MIPDTPKKQVAMPARPAEAEHHVEASIPIIKENGVTSLAAETHDRAQLHKVHHLNLEPDTATVPSHETNAASESANLNQFSAEGNTKQHNVSEATHPESTFDHTEVTPEQPYELESIAVETVGKATELEAETEAMLAEEPDHAILLSNEPVSPESRNQIIEAIEQQFTEIMNNPDNWSWESLQSREEIFHPEPVESSEIKSYEATEFKDLLDEMLNDDDTLVESNPLLANTDLPPVASAEESAAFFTHLETFIQERETHDADEIIDTLQATISKIQDIVKSTALAIESDIAAAEIPAEELESLLVACSQIVEFLGYANTEQNARKLLNRLLASVSDVKLQELRNTDTRMWLNTMGTYEHRFDNALSQLPGSMVVRELLHKAIGQYVLAKAQTMQ